MKIEKKWKYRDLDCMVIAQDLGHRCGYVHVPKNNRFYEIDYNAIIPDAQVNLEHPLQDSFACHLSFLCGKETIEKHTQTLQGIIEVHGGLTFSENWEREPFKGWWLGFDCAHSGDARDPSILSEYAKQLFEFVENKMKEIYERFPFCNDILWTLEMVVSETEKLADQIADEKGIYEKSLEPRNYRHTT